MSPAVVHAGPRAPLTETSLWTILEPLETDGALDSDSNPSVEAYGRLLEKVLLNRESDTKLEHFFDRYTENFSNLNLSSLYYNEKIDWREIGKRTKQIQYRGEPEEQRYYYTTKGATKPLLDTGAIFSKITIQSFDQAFLLSTDRRTNVGSLTAKRSMAILRNINSFLDFNRMVPNAGTDTELLKHYNSRMRQDIPNLSRFFKTFVEFRSVGRPGGETAPSHVVLTYDLQGEAFKQRYPEFYRVFDQTLRPSGLSVTVRDSAGRRLLDYSRDGKTVQWEFFTREGRVVPSTDGEAVNHPGFGPHDLRRMQLESKTSSYMYMFGLYFGMENLTFRSSFDEGKVTWRLIDAPELNLPWGIRLILSPFIQPFLTYLETGPDGEGVVFEASFRSGQDATYRVERLRLPLKDSPFIPFMLKLYNLAWQPLDKAALEDLEQFGRDTCDYIWKDYRSLITERQ